MEYLEIDIKLDNIDPYTEIVIAMLNEIGFDSYIESLEGLKAYIKNDLFDKCIFNETMLKLDGLVGLTYHILQLEDNNWNKEWENNFSPVHISDNCVVRAPFHSSYDIKYEIIITPKMSFGTGHHSTTLLMMQYMFSIDFIDKEVLDLGSGTAILSILASKIGAISVDAIDNDNWAYTNAQENIMLNKASNIRCLCGEIDSILDRKYDVLLVNINRNIIMSQLAKYVSVMRQGSDIILSGFLMEDNNLILDMAEQVGLTSVCSQNKKEWHLLHLRKI